MHSSDQLHQDIYNVTNLHRQLFSIFERFAKDLQNDELRDLGITHSISPHLEQGFFITSIAGRTLYFVFASSFKTLTNPQGIVKCYIKKEFPEQKYIEIGLFNFTKEGKTNLTTDKNEPVTIDCSPAASYVALHFIHEAVLNEWL